MQCDLPGRAEDVFLIWWPPPLIPGLVSPPGDQDGRTVPLLRSYRTFPGWREIFPALGSSSSFQSGPVDRIVLSQQDQRWHWSSVLHLLHSSMAAGICVSPRLLSGPRIPVEVWMSQSVGRIPPLPPMLRNRPAPSFGASIKIKLPPVWTQEPGHYGELRMVKCESVGNSEHKERCDVSDGMKTESDRIQYERPESGPDLIMKVEPEEDVSRWGPPLPRERILLSRTEAGLCSGIPTYAAPSSRFGADRQRRHLGAVLSRPTRGETARFLERERLRNVKFSDRENNVLVKKISENYEKILGKLITGTSAAEKKEIWRDIVAAVNGVSHHTRTVAQCKKRYSDIKKKVKEKLAKQRGGKQVNVFFWPYEKHMLSLMSTKMALSLNGEVDSPAMSEEEDSAHTLTPCEALPIRRSLNDGGQKADSTPGKEDMAEETSLASTEKYDLFSDQDSQGNGDISEAQCDSQQSSSVASPNDPDPHQSDTTLERSLHHLSACVKAQTATLRQTNVILRNLSTNMQNGFQQLVHIIQQVASMPRPENQHGATGQSSTLPTSVPASGHGGRGRPSRGRGRRPHIASNPSRKSRGKS